MKFCNKFVPNLFLPAEHAADTGAPYALPGLNLKLIDFGTCRLINQSTGSPVPMNTLLVANDAQLLDAAG